MRIPDGPTAARVVGWAGASVDVAAGIACALIARMVVPLMGSDLLAAGVILAAAAAGWFLGSRRWAVAFAATSLLVVLVL